MNSPLSILQLTDLHILPEPNKTMADVNTEKSFHQVLKYAHSKHPKADLLLLTGDLVQDPDQSSYQRIYKELEQYQTRTLCLAGNHDDFSLMQQIFNSNLVNCDKQLKLKHWQIICLNSKKDGSHGGYLSTPELNYLTDTLDKHTGLHTLIAIHHHSIPTKSSWMDTMILENRHEFFLSISKYSQVKVIICGHIHQKLEATKKDILMLGTPSTCFQFKPFCTEYTIDIKEPGYRTLLLYPDGKIETEIHHLPAELN